MAEVDFDCFLVILITQHLLLLEYLCDISHTYDKKLLRLALHLECLSNNLKLNVCNLRGDVLALFTLFIVLIFTFVV